METYKKTIKTGETKPNAQQLFMMLQQVSGEHCDLLGYGMEVIGPQKLIWVVVRQKLEILRHPEANEELHFETWPGPTRHGLFPRHYEIYDAKGELIAFAAALWTLVDMDSRKMIKPEEYGIDLKGLTTGREKGNPKAPAKLEISNEFEFVVPEEYLDSNGHMNNTRYYHMAEERISAAIEGKSLRFAATEYANEALLGDKLKISVGSEENKFYITGETDAPIFKMQLEYA